MAYTGALVKLSDTVDRFMLKYKLPMEDAVLYFEHAADCLRNIMTKHSNISVTAKVSVGSNGILEMPTDMMGFVNLYVQVGGELWSFTDKPRMVNTTTGTVGVDEVQDGEGIVDGVSYGYNAKGGVNSYYMNIDWGARRIFLDGFKSDTAVLVYTTSGLVAAGDTMIPAEATDTIDSYLFWKKSWFDGSGRGEKDSRKRDYYDELQQLRILNFMPTGDMLKDIFWGTTTQTPQR